jgi:transposase
MNGIVFVLRTGIRWRDLAERYGPHTTAYSRFDRWSARGIWGRDVYGSGGQIPR